MVRQALRDIRTAPPLPPADPSADPAIAAARRLVDVLAANSWQSPSSCPGQEAGRTSTGLVVDTRARFGFTANSRPHR
ncbi:hypothetical protein [Streptomyces sp. NPDC050287]|uniref:hypothetical protein n=1 Tax=Streptomyces sp. NPDC050287 TaxID=3365608 RepID=UPI003797D65D